MATCNCKTELETERKELNDRIEKLDEKIAESADCAKMPAEERELLNKQLQVMCEYLDILDQRLARKC